MCIFLLLSRPISFTGFSNFEDLEIEVISLNIPPEEISGTFLLNFSIPAVITGEWSLLICVHLSIVIVIIT